MARKLKRSLAAKRRRRLAQIKKQRRCKCGAFLKRDRAERECRTCALRRHRRVPPGTIFGDLDAALKRVYTSTVREELSPEEVKRVYGGLPKAQEKLLEGIGRNGEGVEVGFDAVTSPIELSAGGPRSLPAAGVDPWAHRSKGMSCSTCMWFVRKGTGKLGRCRRHAPTMSGYPAVFETDWCGDHKVDETKL